MRDFVGAHVLGLILGAICLATGYGMGLNIGLSQDRDFVDLTFTEYPQRLDLRTGAVLEQRFGEWTEIGHYDFRHGKPPVAADDPRLLMALPDFGGPIDFFAPEQYPEPEGWKE